MKRFVKKIYHFALAFLAYIYYGRPSRKMIIVGVTGTKGKSTTSRLISAVLEAKGHKVGLLSTVDIQIAGRRVMNKYKMTMLGRGKIHQMLKRMANAGCQYAVIETSSEGILQYRHFGINYDIAVFTNLGTEHQERHGGEENLKKDKGKMFAALQKEKIIDGKKIKKVIIVNGDDKNASYYSSFTADKKIVYGLDNDKNDLQAKNIGMDENGTSFELGNKKISLKLIGKFNIYNALAAVAVGKSQGIVDSKISQGLNSVDVVEGRMEFIDKGQDFKVVVDYAHEPLSYCELFKTLRSLNKTGKLIAIIGSDGGGRDKSKREKMGKIAGELADIVIVTDVNCFDEDPKKIAQMLAIGAGKAGKEEEKDLFIEIDRKKAIQKAFDMAKKDDIVAITAKGTEQCIVQSEGQKIPWDDRVVASELLSNLK